MSTVRSRRNRPDRSRKAKSSDPSPLGIAGGMYQPLSEIDVEKVYHAALDVLEKTGLKGATKTVRELALTKGCRIDDDDRLLFPKALVEDIISGAGRDFVLHGQTPDNDIQISSGHVHFATGGAAVKMLDSKTKAYRPSTLMDLYQAARICDTLPNIQWFARPVVATDIEDWRELDLNTVYAMVKATTKHLGSSIVVDTHVAEIVDMLDLMVGKEGAFAERPFLSVHATTIVSPLSFAGESSDVATAAARAGMPILSQTGPMAGATSPAALAGTLVQTVAEALAGLIGVNLVKPGHPVIASGWPFVVDLRTGAMSGGSGEQALLGAGVGQMMRHLKLPTGVPAGMADSKVPDNQAGYEKALTVALAAMSGPDLVYESTGMLASLLGCSLEAMMIDDEMISCIRRSMRGFEVTEDTLSVEMIDETARDVGHYLGTEQTLSLMESEYIYPELADRLSPDDWTEKGSSDMWSRASIKVQQVLNGPQPTHITPEADTAVRAKFPIMLPAESANLPEDQ